MIQEEQIIRIAKSFGNGAHVFVPKKWAGEHITIIKPVKKPLMERILGVLAPHLSNIIGAYLYGSYARNEQEEDSDIDLLVITSKKIKIREKGFEINCIDEKLIEKIIKFEPLMMYSMLSEARPIINSKLIEDLKAKLKPKLSDFKEYLESCKRAIDINRIIIEENKEYYSGESVPYSLILRLRGIFIILSLLREKKYSHKEFKKWLVKNTPEIDFNLIYKAYKNSKNEMKVKNKIKTEDLTSLLEFLNKEVISLKNKLKHGKKKKEA